MGAGLGAEPHRRAGGCPCPRLRWQFWLGEGSLRSREATTTAISTCPDAGLHVAHRLPGLLPWLRRCPRPGRAWLGGVPTVIGAGLGAETHRRAAGFPFPRLRWQFWLGEGSLRSREATTTAISTCPDAGLHVAHRLLGVLPPLANCPRPRRGQPGPAQGDGCRAWGGGAQAGGGCPCPRLRWQFWLGE